ETITSLLGRGGASKGPYFAEEFLRDSAAGSAVPIDVKVYAFYGEIGQVLLRRVSKHGLANSVSWRYLRADGTDLGDIAYERMTSTDVPVPGDFDDLLDVAALLSKAVALPFVRVDLYSTQRGVVFGELTANPD